MKFRLTGVRWVLALLALVAVSVTAAVTASAKSEKKYVIGVSNTLVGNGWREEMICSVKAQALASGKVSSVKVANRNESPAAVSNAVQERVRARAHGGPGCSVGGED